jgi:hypothetical protein
VTARKHKSQDCVERTCSILRQKQGDYQVAKKSRAIVVSINIAFAFLFLIRRPASCVRREPMTRTDLEMARLIIGAPRASHRTAKRRHGVTALQSWFSLYPMYPHSETYLHTATLYSMSISFPTQRPLPLRPAERDARSRRFASAYPGHHGTLT